MLECVYLGTTGTGKYLKFLLHETNHITITFPFDSNKQMQNRKLDVATSIEMVKREISDDPETIRIVTQISNECAEVTGKSKFASLRNVKKMRISFLQIQTDEDRCEAAYKIIVCTEEASAALGLTFDR